MFEFWKSNTVLGGLPSYVLFANSQAMRGKISVAEACDALLNVPIVTLKCTDCLKIFGVKLVNIVDFILFGGKQKGFMSQRSIDDN